MPSSVEPVAGTAEVPREEHVQRTRSAGFDAHVVKPIDVDRFERLLADEIGRRNGAS